MHYILYVVLPVKCLVLLLAVFCRAFNCNCMFIMSIKCITIKDKPEIIKEQVQSVNTVSSTLSSLKLKVDETTGTSSEYPCLGLPDRCKVELVAKTR